MKAKRSFPLLIWLVVLSFAHHSLAADIAESLRVAKTALADVNAEIAKERERWTSATNTINSLTNNKRTPVQEGSVAYDKCLEASNTIKAVEQGAPRLKAEKQRLEALIVSLVPPKSADGKSGDASSQSLSGIIPELRVPSGTLHGDDVYKQVRITAVEPDGLRISHEGGVVKIPYEKMPPQLRDRFKFDPKLAADFRAMSETKQREAIKWIEEQKKLVSNSNTPQSNVPSPPDKPTADQEAENLPPDIVDKRKKLESTITGSWIYAGKDLHAAGIYFWVRWVFKADGKVETYEAKATDNDWGEATEQKWTMITKKYSDTGKRFYAVRIDGFARFAIVADDGETIFYPNGQDRLPMQRSDISPFSR